MKLRTESVACSLCGSSREQLLFTARDSRTRLIADEFSLVQCEDCGLVFVNPRPLDEELGKLYPPGTYYSLQHPDAMWKGGRQRLKSLAIKFVSGRHNTSCARAGARLLRRIISVSIPYVEGGRILDIGCGSGAYLDLMCDAGWETYGVETAEVGAERARVRGHKIYSGELLDAGFPPEHFDAILMHHVLEHVPNPAAVLGECSRILKGGGLIAINVPNFGCYDRVTFGEHWDPLDIPRHLYHFSPATLRRAMEQAGLEVVRFRYRTWFTSRQFFCGSIRSLNWAKSDRRTVFRVYLRSCILKPLHYLFSAKRDEKFAVTMTAYGSKVNRKEETRRNGLSIREHCELE